MNNVRQYTPVLILIGVAALVFGAFIVVNLFGQPTTTGEGTDEPAAAETTEEAGQTSEENGSEGTPTAESQAGEGDTTESDEGNAANGQSAESGGPTPTSLSRVQRSILIGTQITPVLQVTIQPVSAGDSGSTEGEPQEGEPTPTSLSRVQQSILIGTEVTPVLQWTPSPPAPASNGEDASSGEETPDESENEDQQEATPTPGTDSGSGDDASEGTPEDASGDDSNDESSSEPDAESTEEVSGAAAARFVTPDPPETDIPTILNPQGSVAERQSSLWWFMFVLGSLVYLIVVGLVLWLVSRNWRKSNSQISERQSRILIWSGGVIIPLIVLTILFVLTLHTMVTLASDNKETTLTIEVTGHQWWWEVTYQESGLVTANEIHIPVGEPVRFDLKSADVLHSFWVPQLGGKLDLFPNRTNTFWLQANEAGEYRGQCAEFCGMQHAHMAFFVIAHEPAEFEAWLDGQQREAREPDTESLVRGRDTFLSSDCAACHTVRGTDAAGKQGPDLTHFGSRKSIGAGTLAHTQENLENWIANSQQFKPGNFMPPQNLEDENLQAVAAYLLSLR